MGVVAVDVACVDGHNGVGDPAAGFPSAVGPEGGLPLSSRVRWLGAAAQKGQQSRRAQAKVFWGNFIAIASVGDLFRS